MDMLVSCIRAVLDVVLSHEDGWMDGEEYKEANEMLMVVSNGMSGINPTCIF